MKMKKYSIILLFLGLVVSCDPTTNLTHKIKNSSSRDLTILFFYSIDQSDTLTIDRIDTLTINKNDVKIWLVDIVNGSAPRIDFSIVFDSIIIYSDTSALKKYFSNTQGKSIYNYKYWDENKKGKRDYEYTFEITNQDLNIK